MSHPAVNLLQGLGIKGMRGAAMGLMATRLFVEDSACAISGNAKNPSA